MTKSKKNKAKGVISNESPVVEESKDDTMDVENNQDEEMDDNTMLEDDNIGELENVDDAGDNIEGPSEVGGFTVLGDFKLKEKKKVARILPNWLQHPVLIQGSSSDTFSSIQGLDQSLINKLKDNGIELCFPVQRTVIPEILAQSSCGVYAGDAGYRPRDVCISAPTGSGKTLTFVLPIIQALQNRVVPHVRALAILPVRDLAFQVYRVFKQYTQGTPLKVVLIAGKKEFHSEQGYLVRKRPHSLPSEQWASLADIVVATKGRLLDHIERTEGFDLSHLRFLVIDEADRQMNDVYDDWLSQVETAAYTPKPGAYAPYHRERPGALTVAK
ncbi:ATP-dependent RNA helicase ddx51 [Bulinus truncatus]|nr:ATP-dependent RNA helicase ddx51 [Bulinus truncatus]